MEILKSDDLIESPFAFHPKMEAKIRSAIKQVDDEWPGVHPSDVATIARLQGKREVLMALLSWPKDLEKEARREAEKR